MAGEKMKQEIDCSTCVHDEPNYVSVIGTIPHCCQLHWHCKPGAEAKDYIPKSKGGDPHSG